MRCFKPHQGFRSKKLSKNGKRMFTRHVDRALLRAKIVSVQGQEVRRHCPVEMTTPCHRCEGCRFDASRQMAIRASHEAWMYDRGFNNAFLTLTYNDDGLPWTRSLDYSRTSDFQRFFKALRAELYEKNIFIRYYVVGEYGDLNLRPHYHALIFGYNFPDKYFLFRRNGHDFYHSPTVERLWAQKGDRSGRGSSLGFHSIGDVNFTTAAYVARYNIKKLLGNHLDDLSQYEDDYGVCIPKRLLRFNRETGEPYAVERERAIPSRRPGLGKAWFDAYADDFYKDGTGTMHDVYGGIIRSPRYYDEHLKKIRPDQYESIRKSRMDFAVKNSEIITPESLVSARLNLLDKLSRSKRNL